MKVFRSFSCVLLATRPFALLSVTVFAQGDNGDGGLTGPTTLYFS